MYRLFRDIATEDERILAIYRNGSRTNRNAVQDIFQDCDIVFVVKDITPFINEREKWYTNSLCAKNVRRNGAKNGSKKTD